MIVALEGVLLYGSLLAGAVMLLLPVVPSVALEGVLVCGRLTASRGSGDAAASVCILHTHDLS